MLNGNLKFRSADESNNMALTTNRTLINETESPKEIHSDIKLRDFTRGRTQANNLIFHPTQSQFQGL